MKLDIDEGVPKQILPELRRAGIDASKFRNEWKQTENGELIRMLEAAGVDVLLTNDKNIVDQQSLRGRRMAVVALP